MTDYLNILVSVIVFGCVVVFSYFICIPFSLSAGYIDVLVLQVRV